MSARFFIDRPIFAAVLSIVITLAGGVAAYNLPLSPYPPIAPPTVQVDCNYPGASSQVVAQTLAAPIEQQVNGVEDMLYMSSQCTNEGTYTLTVTFKPGVDLNLAQVLVQNRVNLALPLLPDIVRQTGVTTRKRSADILLTVSINSPSGRYNQLYLSNYSVIHLKDELSRIPGISDVTVFGQRDYSMRIWVDPQKLAVRELTAGDVVQAVREQNTAVATGQIGQSPTTGQQPFQITLSTQGRLTEVADFENIVVRALPGGQHIRVKDIGRVELGARSEDISNRFNRKATVGLAIFQLPDANALETSDLVKAKIKELSRDFPEGVTFDIGYDTSPFIRESILEVFHALRDAIILVALVVLVFLQGWRAAIIPLIAVPVAIIGTFGALLAFGFTLNNLTLFGLVLAIGIVVDDAIVVVEAVEHHIERGLAPRAAAIQAMEEVSAPVVAVGLVLSAVFIPCAFISGIVGQFFRQFALTIAVSTIISTFNSLTLSPALAALLLRPRNGRRDFLTRFVDLCCGWFFRLFNRAFRGATTGYLFLVGRLLRMTGLAVVVYGGLLLLTYWGYLRLPTGFIPSQDKGYMVASVQLPDNASADRTQAVIRRAEEIALATPGVRSVNSVAGNSFMLSAYGSNFGSMFINLHDFSKRRSHELSGDEIVNKLRKQFGAITGATVNVFPAPAISGLGRAGGFRLMIEDRGDVGLATLQGQTDNLIEKANQQPGLAGLFTVFKADSPQLFVDVSRRECLAHGVPLPEVFGTLQTYLGSRYVNDFNRFGRSWQVVVQADSRFRNQVEDVKNLRVRNVPGQMVSMGSLATVREITGPLVYTRYNMYPAATVQGNVAPGFSTGQAIALLEQLAQQELPASMSYEWTEIMYLERMSGNTGLAIFALSVMFVFLVLAALYESWSLPFAVILVVPMCVLGSIAGVAIAKQDINIFTQIGFVVLIGLASKNAILIVEFAKYRRDEGADARQSILEACRLRLRPILMTSFAFILGVIPLVLAHGAGAEMRRALGTAVFSGMLGVTLFGIFMTPVFFVVVDRVSRWGVFRSAVLRQVSRLTLQGLHLRWLRPSAWQPRRRATEAPQHDTSPSNEPSISEVA